ncbi:hypothetical protein SAMD00019534_086390 [Acytostelium subglobosum LB1]|uniref:hypothetical protein n=1 Tax=Acytostelium subglobosum LB1 TaxID=1410327 RepID=UPI000644A68A|nr:hypothetical protein SAMD00019534_086390 [Acytostelium subglobosum LB1]GAM25464.1 hypothetical protein SAMD00019534_086390 [Acytostelium subglobosum LB1]|eukprot:XP_012751450.1 hypothetical protein SAMD00019534_086390 [Acytostelium subglobosum LB1]
MTIIKSMTALSFNASAISNGSVSSGSMNAFGQSSNSTSGVVAQIGKNLQPAIDGIFASANATLATVITTVDGLVSSTIGL